LSKVLVVVLLIALAGASLPAQQLDPITTWATMAAYEYDVYPDIVYKRASNVDLKLDVITAGPKSQMRPTVVYFHGGGWMAETKADTGLYYLPYLAQGMDFVNVDYRLASVALAPAAVEDCRCALRWVYRHASEYGFDTSKLVVEGHSAGGHLALMTGMLDSSAGFDNECPGKENLKVNAIVNYAGITDVVDLLQGPHTTAFALMWLGSLPDRMELAKKLSPLSYVRPGSPPIITVHGDKDTLVPYEQAVRLHEALDRAGAPNELVPGHGAAHCCDRSWTRQGSALAQEAVLKFLQQHGVLELLRRTDYNYRGGPK